MTRRYEERIEVRREGVEAMGRATGPEAFVWRGRLYVVREVIDHWQERRAWWREALDSPVRSTASTGPGTSADPRERRVWRVAASPGRMAGTGVFDLGEDGEGVHDDGASAGWVLLRVQD